MMRRVATSFAVLLLLLVPSLSRAHGPTTQQAVVAAGPGRMVESIDRGWRFSRGDVEGAEAREFDASSWTTVNVPHDWSIEGPFSADAPTLWRGGYLPSGVAWYRREIAVENADRSRHLFLDFDGVMANGSVYLNGNKLGTRPYGYIPVRYDLTPHLRFDGKPNVLAVRVDTSDQPASRWYTGAGIYRHAYLVRTSPVHVDHWGVFVTTPRVSADEAIVSVRVRVTNQSDAAQAVKVNVHVLSDDRAVVGTPTTRPVESAVMIAAGETAEIQREVVVSKPQLWGPRSPVLYRAVASVTSNTGDPLDTLAVPFGIRDVRFEADTGFWINGENLKLKGVCLHHDAGSLGAAVPISVWEHRLRTLRAMGCNAIRTSHNAADPALLDLADRMGFLVMDEAFDAWSRSKVTHDYGSIFDTWWRRDLTDQILCNRNHPSIVIYSAGNEIHDVLYDPPLGLNVFRELREVYHALDPTRPVTVAVNQPERSKIHDTGFADLMDVAGYNYAEQFSVDGRRARPDRKIIGTENAANSKTWRICRDNPALAGVFLWTGFDYIGESVRRWPYFTFEFGLFDFSGNPRPEAAQFRAYWTSEPTIAVARLVSEPPLPSGTKLPRSPRADWNPDEKPGEQVDLQVYSNCKFAELILNGRSLGSREVPTDASPLKWPTLYEPGELLAIGRNEERGPEVCRTVLRTAGPATGLRLAASRESMAANEDEIVYVTTTLIDANGTRVPHDARRVTFDVSGTGALRAVESANLADHDAFAGPSRRFFDGRCTALVRGTDTAGEIVVRATTDGMDPAELRIKTTVTPDAALPLPER